MKKNKTATITWHYYNNYGTQLQEYALQQYITSLGYYNCIFDDTDILNHYRNGKTNNSNLLRRIKRVVFTQLSKIKQYITNNQCNPYELSQKKINYFKKHYLNIKRVKFETLQTISKSFDCFVCGSDQIWSPLDCNFYGYYWLDFTGKKKISYATSLGTLDIQNRKCEIINYLKTFNSISVREQQSSEQLKELVKKEVNWVCDPTLLFDKHFYIEFTKKIKTKNTQYILCYFLENKEWYFDYANKIAISMGLKILLIPNRSVFNSNEHIIKEAVGPKEFISYFRDASYIITDSYHGSIFSLLFGKRFSHLLRFGSNDFDNQNIRIDSLFSYLGIDKIIVTNSNYEKHSKYIIDYAIIDKKINTLREKSKDYLKNALQKSGH